MSPITPENILRHELVGLDVKVNKSSNKQLVGLKGRVVDETRNMLIIFNGEERKAVPKDISTFHFSLPNGTIVEVDGKMIVGRPENRVKMRVKAW
jgi:ribonuclease P protein subunit POP4